MIFTAKGIKKPIFLKLALNAYTFQPTLQKTGPEIMLKKKKATKNTKYHNSDGGLASNVERALSFKAN